MYVSIIFCDIFFSSKNYLGYPTGNSEKLRLSKNHFFVLLALEYA